MKNKAFIKNSFILIISLVLLNVNIITSQAYADNSTPSFSHETIKNEDYKIYFVIGIGVYWPYQGTWPAINEISPVILLKIGFSECEILRVFSSESIDFIAGDKFIGFYPFWTEFRNMIFFFDIPFNRIGFICGIWLDKQ
jgi:hypothetical protein